MTRIAVLGAGSWGTALANHLVRRRCDVLLWSFEPEVAEAINREHHNPLYAPGVLLDPALLATADPAQAVRGRTLVVSVSPSQTVRGVLTPLAPAIEPGAVIVGASKGIEIDTLMRMSEVVGEALPGHPYVVLSGPSFAEEVEQGQPTAVVAASQDPASAAEVQQLFATPAFRVYTSEDVVGTELAGSLKNVIAIAAGAAEQLGFGDNGKAGLITRGLAEMTRLGMAAGAHPLTFAGLAGLGDVIATCYSALSRNHALGVELAKGRKWTEIEGTLAGVAEGAYTVEAALALAKQHDVEMPIAQEVHNAIYEGKSVQRCLIDLLSREQKDELADVEQWARRA